MKLTPEIIEKMHNDRRVRRAIVRRSHAGFFGYYFPHYIQYEAASFHHEMFSITQDESIKLAVMTGFRESAKSTIMAMSFPIWAVVGQHKANFIVLTAKTQMLARQMLKNIKDELEKNQLLKNDLGPFETISDQWGAYAIHIKYYDAFIIAVSRDQSVRGVRHRQHRPQIIICDDIDDLASVKTQDSRDDTFRWFSRDIVPLGNKNTRIILLGSPLHEDSLIMRLKKAIEDGKRSGIFRSYPIIDEQDKPLWPAKFPALADIEEAKMKVDELSWQREYMLKIVPEDGQVVEPAWLHYYDYNQDLPSDRFLSHIYVGVDLAISPNKDANRTAMVTLKIYSIDDKTIAYVMPHPFNATVGFPEQVRQVKMLINNFRGHYPMIFVEKTFYQDALVQELGNRGIKVEGVNPHGDKKERLTLTTAAIKNGLVLFPKKGAEELINQLVGFGMEKYDDLADAFSLVVNQFIAQANKPVPRLTVISTIPRRRSYIWDDDDDYDFEVPIGFVGF